MSIFFILRLQSFSYPADLGALLGKSEQANTAEQSLSQLVFTWVSFSTLTGVWGEVRFPGGPEKGCQESVGLYPISDVEFGAMLC